MYFSEAQGSYELLFLLLVLLTFGGLRIAQVFNAFHWLLPFILLRILNWVGAAIDKLLLLLNF